MKRTSGKGLGRKSHGRTRGREAHAPRSGDAPKAPRQSARRDDTPERGDTPGPAGRRTTRVDHPPRSPIGIATALLQSDGRVLHWSSGAESLLGYRASEIVGDYAAGLLINEDQRDEALALYARILDGESWTGTFPLRHRDGRRVEIEFRSCRIDIPDAPPLVLATAVDARAVQRVEADLAVLDSFFRQSPVGMAVYDDALRFVRINDALARKNGLPAAEHLGKHVRDVVRGTDGERVEQMLRSVLETGTPIVDARSRGPLRGHPGRDHTWSASYSRLQDTSGRVFGVSSSVSDITERHVAETQAARARERLVLMAEASAAIGSTLDPRQAAEELVRAMVPALADACGVYILERRMNPGAPTPADPGVDVVERVAFDARVEDFPFEELPIGERQELEAGGPYAEALRLKKTTAVAAEDMPSLRANPRGRLNTQYAHMTQPLRIVPLIARGTVLGMVTYVRRADREPFDEQDLTVGEELAARAAAAIDNALLYLRERETARSRQEALRQATAARERLALLNDASTRIGTTLDLQRTAEELTDVVLPRFADFSTVDLLDSVMRGDEPSRVDVDGEVVLRAVAAAEAFPHGLANIADSVGHTTTFESDKGYARSLRTGTPLFIPLVDHESLASLASDPTRVEPGMSAGVRSYLMIPLRARGVVLGGAEFIRMNGREPFTDADVALAEDLVARAALCIDNARLYRRERATALTLQRSLLPQEVHHTLGMEIAYRYLPSSVVSEVGGDWFDVIPLSCGRVALVVGDVMGHGIRAAATMGQLRTVARTLATLDMEPEQVLSRLDETAAAVGDDQFATCLCVVYDPVERAGVVACAGHLPPVIVTPDGHAEAVDVPPGVPLGVGGVAFESVEFALPTNGILTLYTDGLVERRGRDIAQGMEELLTTLSGRGRTLEETCDAVISALVPGGAEDDVAVIMAKTVPLYKERVATLALTGDLRLAGQARRFTRAKLESWGLAALIEPAELLVSELVANALMHTARPRQLRLFCDRALTVEVADSDVRPPIARQMTDYGEGGRGIRLVEELAHRWGSRTTRHGKVVWFELELPTGWGFRNGSGNS